MKNLLINKYLKPFFGFLSISLMFSLSGCDVEDPVKEETPELITKVTLTFTPEGGGTAVVVSATDPDGEGVQELTVDGPINLSAGQTYDLSITLINALLLPNEAGYDVTVEVEEEGDEHIFFFEWTGNVFSDPSGNGNVDSRGDDVNYEDEDENQLPIGIRTSWTTAEISSGIFRVVLKHQPDLKSETSDASTGETDVDVEFEVNVQ